MTGLRKRSRVWGAAAALTGLAMVLAACGGGDSPDAQPDHTDAPPSQVRPDDDTPPEPDPSPEETGDGGQDGPDAFEDWLEGLTTGVDAGDSAQAFDMDIPLAEVTNRPAHVREDGAIVLGVDRTAGGQVNPDAAELAIYLDFMCVMCYNFEVINWEVLDDMVSAGEVTLALHPVAILDAGPGSAGTSASTRTSAALVWLADQAPEHVLDWYEMVFLLGPHAMTGGLSNESLAAVAELMGVPAGVAAGIADGTAVETFGQWVTSATGEAVSNEALRGGHGFGTPTLTINGQLRLDLDWRIEGLLRQEVLAAGS